MKEYFNETAITYDKNLGKIHLDTTDQRLKTKLKKLGAKSTSNFGPYSNYELEDTEFSISIRRKVKRTFSESHKEKLKDAVSKARAARLKGQTTN